MQQHTTWLEIVYWGLIGDVVGAGAIQQWLCVFIRMYCTGV